MPLRDHFRPPLSVTRPWEGFHSAWATMIAQQLNRMLPLEYVAIPQTSRGPMVEVDVAALQLSGGGSTGLPAWAAPPPAWSGQVEWPERDLFEVLVQRADGEPRLVGAVELVSPANKDRPAARQSFAGKCAGYLRSQVGLVVIDVVTSRQSDLHRELLLLLELDAPMADWGEADVPLYAASYRTTAGDRPRLELWPERLALGAPLPTLPLWLGGALPVPLELQSSYAAACELLRIG